MKKLAFLFIGLVLLLSSCMPGPEKIEKNIFGEDSTVVEYLDEGEKLVDVDWKIVELNAKVQSFIWILTRKMVPGDTAVSYKYTNGKYTLILKEQMK